MKTTPEQDTAIAHLSNRYGTPTVVRFEMTTVGATGLLWLHWPDQDSSWGRNLFIKPDGNRLAWLTQ